MSKLYGSASEAAGSISMAARAAARGGNSMIGWGKTLIFGRESYSRRFRTSPRA